MSTTQQDKKTPKAQFKVSHKQFKFDSDVALKPKHTKALCQHPIVDQVLTLPKGVYCLATAEGFTGLFQEAVQSLLIASQEGHRKPVKPSKLQPMELELLNDVDSIYDFFEKESNSNFDLGEATQHLGAINPFMLYRPVAVSGPSEGLLRAQSCILVARIAGQVVGFAQIEQDLCENINVLFEEETLPETEKIILPYFFYNYISNLVVCDTYKKSGVAETLVAGAAQAFTNFIESSFQNPTDYHVSFEAMIETDAHTKRGQKCHFFLQELVEEYLSLLDMADVIDTEKHSLIVAAFN